MNRGRWFRARRRRGPHWEQVLPLIIPFSTPVDTTSTVVRSCCKSVVVWFENELFFVPGPFDFGVDAWFISPVLKATTSSATCRLLFYYYIYGLNENKIEIYVRNVTADNIIDTKAFKEKSVDEWKQASLTLQSPGSEFQVCCYHSMYRFFIDIICSVLLSDHHLWRLWRRLCRRRHRRHHSLLRLRRRPLKADHSTGHYRPRNDSHTGADAQPWVQLPGWPVLLRQGQPLSAEHCQGMPFYGN